MDRLARQKARVIGHARCRRGHPGRAAAPREPDLVAKDAARVATLERDASEIRTWLRGPRKRGNTRHRPLREIHVGQGALTHRSRS